MNTPYFLSLESRLVLGIARGIIGGDDDPVRRLSGHGPVDWSAFSERLTYHGLLPFAHRFLKPELFDLPADLRRTLKASQDYYLGYNLFLAQRFLELRAVLLSEGVEIVPIKGVALLDDLYGRFPMRPSTDIDILIRRQDLDKVCGALGRIGYQRDFEGLSPSYWFKHHYHLVFVRQDASEPAPLIEAHWALDYPRAKTQLLPVLFSRLRKIPIQSEEVSALSVEDTFFSLALHQRRFGTPLCLKEALDMAMLLRKYQSKFDWEYLINESKASRLRSTVFFALAQVTSFFDIEIPGFVWKRLAVPAWKQNAIRRFILRSTFLPDSLSRIKQLFAQAHFLLYDGAIEPLRYIAGIPQEQFAKFYALEAYTAKTARLYRFRLFYMFWLLIRRCLPGIPAGQSLGCAGDGCMLMEVLGGSMWPFLIPGGMILVKKEPPGRVRRGDLIVYNSGTLRICHRVLQTKVALEGRQFIVRGDNAPGAEIVKEADYIGKAVAYCKNGRMRPLSGAGQRLVGQMIIVFAPVISRANHGLNLLYEKRLSKYRFFAACRARIRALIS